MVFVAHSSLCGLTDDNELICILLVCEVLVQVILEVLDHVHMLLDQVVSSHSVERERLVIELISVSGQLWVLSLFLQFVVNSNCTVVILLVEGS